jgi:hypothetical protein
MFKVAGSKAISSMIDGWRIFVQKMQSDGWVVRRG